MIQQDRIELRRYIREFLGAYSETDITAVLYWRGTPLATRGQLTVMVRGFRPRIRKIIEADYEQGRRRQDVCKELQISVKTLERDQVEALDQIIDRLLPDQLAQVS